LERKLWLIQKRPITDTVFDSTPKIKKNALPNRDKPEYTLSNRIEAAIIRGIAGPETVKMARFVKNIANDFIHPQCERKRELNEKFMLMIIMETIEVIQALSKTSDK